ncbi:hypothetical protein [Rothia dentocariosa]|uniref:hypothetical protein n=1 Tax=Rothia dentocariosa TaxID=2047 RepID=UPI0028803FFE|nr:hypothetical protein [Rothia dentocariosa]
MKFDSFVSGNLDKFGKKLVQKERGEPAMRIIRIGYLWEMIYRFLRLGWISYGFTDRRGLWVVLSKASISQKFVSLFKNLLSLPVIFSFILACFSLNILNFTEIQEWVISSLNFNINISDVFSALSKLPILVTILALVPTIFFFYFYSQKRDVRKIIDREGNKRLEETILLYEELMSWIDQNLYEISQNYEYVISVQELIVEMRLEKRISNYNALKDRRNYSLPQIDNYRFIELPEVKDLVAVIDKLLSDRLCRFTRVVALKSYAIWELYWELSSLKDLDRANYSFYTKCGMDNDISNRSKVLLYVTEKNLEKEQEYESSTLAHDIYRKLKMLYVLKRGSDALRKYLYSSRIERFLVRALQKEK